MIPRVAVVAVATAGPILLAQQAPLPAFEVASVKANPSSSQATTIGTQLGRYTATHVTLRTLIVNAYGLQNNQLSGGPGWIGSDHFDVVAKIPAESPQEHVSEQVALMLRALLVERFKLAVHTESRTLPIFALVPARSDRKLGPNLRPSPLDCVASSPISTVKEKESKQKTKEERGTTPPRGQRASCTVTTVPGRIAGGGMTMPMLAESLFGAVQRTVVDHTGLSGAFDVELKWTPEHIPQGNAQPRVKDGTVKPTPIDPNGPSLFSALQEQLGLKLQSAKGPVDVVIIDHCEKPTPN